MPALLWLALIPALIIGALQLRTGGGMPVHVVGSGPLVSLVADDAPEDTFFRFYVEPSESLRRTAERSFENLGLWPDMIVLGFDASSLPEAFGPEEEAATRAQLRALTEASENAAAVTVLVNFQIPFNGRPGLRGDIERLNEWMEGSLCGRLPLLHCVDVAALGDSPAATRRAISAGVEDAKAQADALRDRILTWR